MSKEWLAQLSATAANRHQGRPGFRVQPRPQADTAAPTVPAADLPQRGFIGAIIGSIIRWVVLSAIAGAIFVFILLGDEFGQSSLGEKVLYALMSLATAAPSISGEVAAAIDPAAIFYALQPYADWLPFLVPLAVGIAVTLLFLPTVNAYRRRSGLRFFFFLFNLLLLYIAWINDWIGIDLTGREGWIGAQTLTVEAIIAWAVLLLLSFVRVRRGRSTMLLPTSAPVRPGRAPARMATAAAPPSHAATTGRAAEMIARRNDPTIQRSVSGGSWRRPR